MSLPARWRPLLAYFEVLLAPLIEAETGSWMLLEGAGPDGTKWTSRRPLAVRLGPDLALRAVRAVARLCGASATTIDPGPEGQALHGVYYVPSSLHSPHRADRNAAALAAILLDIDDRNHGGRDGSHDALARVLPPTAIVRSGGGLQAAYVLREAIALGPGHEGGLAATVRNYLAVTLGLQAITGADETWWPSHLFRCPGTYHLKQPSRPVLVEVDVYPERRFNLSDLDDYACAMDDVQFENATDRLAVRLTGRRAAPPTVDLAALPSIPDLGGGPRRVLLPRRVSPAMLRLLNGRGHRKYRREDGSLDYSRAVCAAAASLLQAGLSEAEVAAVIVASALRPALDRRGRDARRWLSFQIGAAHAYLAKRRAKEVCS